MLYRLEIQNFYSIRDLQVLDLEVARNAPSFPERFAPLFPGSDRLAPKVVALFGANGSGKTTVLKALSFLPWFIKESFSRTVPGVPCERFNDDDSANRTIFLAVELGGLSRLVRQAAEDTSPEYSTYRYELELGTENGNVSHVVREALHQKRSGIGKWLRVFERDKDGVKGSSNFSLAGYAQVLDKIRPNASLVSTLSLFEHEPSQVLSDTVSRLTGNIFLDHVDLNFDGLMKHLGTFPEVLSDMNRELQRIDVGIERMEIVRGNDGPVPYFTHTNLSVPMPWQLESHGTRKFIQLYPMLRYALLLGGIAVVDEMDIAIHPMILPEVQSWFYNPERNPYDGQLWMSCHSVSLLENLEKEEVVICEKDRLGRTTFYSATSIKNLRRSDNLYVRYMSGVLGGVPRIG